MTTESPAAQPAPPAGKIARTAILAFLTETGGASTLAIASLYSEYGRPRPDRQSTDVPDEQRARAWASRHLSVLSRKEKVAKRGKNWIVLPYERERKLVPPDMVDVIEGSVLLKRSAADAERGEVCLTANMFKGLVEETMNQTLAQTEIA